MPHSRAGKKPAPQPVIQSQPLTNGNTSVNPNKSEPQQLLQAQPTNASNPTTDTFSSSTPVKQETPSFLQQHAWLMGAGGLVMAQWTAYALYQLYQNKNKTSDVDQLTQDFSQLTAEELIEEMSALDNDSGFWAWIKKPANWKMVLVSAGLLSAGAALDYYRPMGKTKA